MLGYEVVDEAATDIIAAEQAVGNLEPWKQGAFIDQITALQKKRQMEAKAEVQLYDRSPFCTYALARYMNVPISPLLVQEVERCLKEKLYQPDIFFFEDLGFIEHTNARRISYEETLQFGKLHLEIYKEFGFDILSVPNHTVEERCKLIRTHLKA